MLRKLRNEVLSFQKRNIYQRHNSEKDLLKNVTGGTYYKTFLLGNFKSRILYARKFSKVCSGRGGSASDYGLSGFGFKPSQGPGLFLENCAINRSLGELQYTRFFQKIITKLGAKASLALSPKWDFLLDLLFLGTVWLNDCGCKLRICKKIVPQVHACLHRRAGSAS